MIIKTSVFYQNNYSDIEIFMMSEKRNVIVLMIQIV